MLFFFKAETKIKLIRPGAKTNFQAIRGIQEIVPDFCALRPFSSYLSPVLKKSLMTITIDHVVAVSYHLTVPGENGGDEVTVEKTHENEPFMFLFGAGGLLPEFEGNLNGKKVGDTFDFRITAANGYGTYQAEHVVKIPIEAFLDESGKLDTEMVVVGKTLPMMDNEGHRLMGVVKAVALDHVEMDFNHPLAGKDLHFVGEVLEVRPASAEELAHGHVHGPGGHHH